MKEISKTKYYTEFQSKGMGDLYVYGEVMNNHFVSREWNNGVALVEMTYGCWAIFNGHNNKVYVIYESNVPDGWIRDQFIKCAVKYSNLDDNLDIRVTNEKAVYKIMAKQQALDY